MAATFLMVPAKSFSNSLRTVYSSSPMGRPRGLARSEHAPSAASPLVWRRNCLLFSAFIGVSLLCLHDRIRALAAMLLLVCYNRRKGRDTPSWPKVGKFLIHLAY